MRDLIIPGGANGAGKTTSAAVLLPDRLQVREFVNADEIARGLSPIAPETMAFAAGRLVIERVRGLRRAGESFAIETTCAGVGHLRLVKDCKEAGYSITLLYLWLPSVEIAIERVANRVRLGGHGLPTDVIVRRYHAGIRNMRRRYLPLADIGLIYDNSGNGPVLIAEAGSAGLVVLDHQRWAKIEEAAT